MNSGIAGLLLSFGDTGTPPPAGSTWDPAKLQTNSTLSSGDLTVTFASAAEAIPGTQGRSYGSGPWSGAVTVTGADGNFVVGIGTTSAFAGAPFFFPGFNSNGWGYYGQTGHKLNSTDSAYGATFAPGDVISWLLAADGKLTFYKNGVSQGVAFDLNALGVSSSASLYPMCGSGTSSAGNRIGTWDSTSTIGGGTAWG